MIRFLVTQLPRELTQTDLTHLAELLSRALRIKRSCNVSLSFVTPAKIQSLNKRYRGKDRPTDVLSFSAREGALPEEVQKASTAWGDVIICPAYAKAEAKRRSLPLQEELARLVIHGVLHLAGHDHATEKDELQMFGLQERIIERLMSYV